MSGSIMTGVTQVGGRSGYHAAMTVSRPALLLALLLALAAASAGAEGEPNLPQLRVRAPVTSVAAGPDSDLRVLLLRPERLAAARRELAARGVQVLASLPENGLLVAGGDEQADQLDGLLGRAAWTPQQAVVPEIAAMTPDQARSFPAGVPVLLGLATGQDLQAALARLPASGARVSWVDTTAVPPQTGLLVPAARIGEVRQALAATSGLVWADLQPPLALRNSDTIWRCQTGIPDRTSLFTRGLRGEGQIIGLMDTGIDIDLCYFADTKAGLPALNDHQGTAVDLNQRKVLAVDFYWQRDWPSPGPLSWDSSGHGSHVAGTIAGHSTEPGWWSQQNGVAPRAQLVVQDGGGATDDCADLPGLGCPVRPLEPVLQQAYDQGARIHNDSWGDEENILPFNRYTERTADIDRFCWNHKDFLVVIAAGNAGPEADTVGSPATGKNVIAAGATEHGSIDPPCPATFSSRGWTEDGRIKPDLLAPGRHIWSALSDNTIETGNCSAGAKSGTSMAAPALAGLAAQVRQYYSQGYYPDGEADSGIAFAPSAALVRATLIAAAVDLTTLGCSEAEPVPSRAQGWGLVQLDRALAFSSSTHRLVVDDHGPGFAGSDDSAVATVVHQVDRGPLRAVLVWTDPPSCSAAAVNLVNDLDLRVEGSDGVYLGNVFAGGVSRGGGEADRRNNVEVVWLPEAAAGDWRITVTPHTISEAPQDFALVLTLYRPAPAPRSGPGGRRTPA